jgi:serine/threonine protein phosphatase PrpC
MKFISSAATDVGQCRQENEDAFHASEEHGLFVVADGMGGHREGAQAAQRAVGAFVLNCLAGKAPHEAAQAADDAVISIEGKPSYRSPGSTLTAIVFGPGCAKIAHAGDSEAWRLCAEGGFQKVSKNHAGLWGLDNFCGKGRQESEAFKEPFFVDIEDREANQGDRFLVASDGLTKHIKEDELQKIWKSTATKDLAQHLVDLCNERGGNDNITVIAIEVIEC